MTIHGKEIGFALTIGASVEIAKMCPNNDITRISEVLEGDYVQTVSISAKLIKLMNDGYVGIEELNGRKADRLTDEEIMLLTPKELNELTASLMKVFVQDSHGEIETESKNAEKGAQEN